MKMTIIIWVVLIIFLCDCFLLAFACQWNRKSVVVVGGTGILGTQLLQNFAFSVSLSELYASFRDKEKASKTLQSYKLATEGQSGEGKASTSQAVAAGTATTEPPFVKPTLVNKLQLVGLGLAVVMLVQTFVQLNLAEQTAITGDRRDGTGTGTGTGQSESTDFEVGNPIDCKPTDA